MVTREVVISNCSFIHDENSKETHGYFLKVRLLDYYWSRVWNHKVQEWTTKGFPHVFFSGGGKFFALCVVFFFRFWTIVPFRNRLEWVFFFPFKVYSNDVTGGKKGNFFFVPGSKRKEHSILGSQFKKNKADQFSRFNFRMHKKSE